MPKRLTSLNWNCCPPPLAISIPSTLNEYDPPSLPRPTKNQILRLSEEDVEPGKNEKGVRHNSPGHNDFQLFSHEAHTIGFNLKSFMFREGLSGDLFKADAVLASESWVEVLVEVDALLVLRMM